MKERRDKFRKILIDNDIDAILIKSKSNKRYIGALPGSGVKVLITKDHIYKTYGRPASEEEICKVLNMDNERLDEVLRYNESEISINKTNILSILKFLNCSSKSAGVGLRSSKQV